MGCMSFGNYLLTLFLIVFMSIFFATSAIINQVVIKLAENPNSVPGFSYKHTSAYTTMNIVFGIIAAIIIVLIAVFAFLTKAGNCCNKDGGGGGSSKSVTGVTVSLVIGFILFAVFSSLFIGNSIFLAKMKGTIDSDPALIAVAPNTVQVFYIINAILAAISTTLTFLALLAFILLFIPGTRAFVLGIFGVRPKIPGVSAATAAATAAATKSKNSAAASTKSLFEETIELTTVQKPPVLVSQSIPVSSPLSSTTKTTTTATSTNSANSATPSTQLADINSLLAAAGQISTPLGSFPPVNLF